MTAVIKLTETSILQCKPHSVKENSNYEQQRDRACGYRTNNYGEQTMQRTNVNKLSNASTNLKKIKRIKDVWRVENGLIRYKSAIGIISHTQVHRNELEYEKILLQRSLF